MSGISKFRTAIVLVILVSVFLAVFFWRKAELPSPASEERQKAEQNTTVETVGASQEVAQTTTKKAIPAYQPPSYDKPFDEVFDELKLASDGGDARATCRFAIELMRCQLMLAMNQKQMLNLLNEPISKDRGEDYKNAFEKLNFETSQMFLSCRKMHEDELLKTQDYLEKAARQKQPDAMVLWASGEWLKTRYGRSAAYLQDPAYDRWRASAIPTMNEALQLGSYGAALEWALAYSTDNGLPNGTLFHGMVKDDPKLAYTFLTLVTLLENSSAPRSSNRGLSPSDALAAEQNARQMFEKWFDSKASRKGHSSTSYGLRGPEHEDCNW